AAEAPLEGLGARREHGLDAGVEDGAGPRRHARLPRFAGEVVHEAELLLAAESDELARVDPEDGEVRLEALQAGERVEEHLELEGREASELDGAHLADELGEVLHAEPDVAGLVLLVVEEQLGEDRLDLEVADLVE